METQPTRESVLEVLQSYPLGTLDVLTPDGAGRLVALPMGQMSERVMADVLLDSRKERGIALAELYSLNDVTPMLRSFSDMVKPLADGSIPAIEVAKLLPDSNKYNFDGAEADLMNGGQYIRVAHPNRSQLAVLYPDDFGLGEQPLETVLAVVSYLRRNHFAVSLTPEQYVPLESKAYLK